jgi:hypothetical protein
MSKRDIGQEILDGIRNVKAYKDGTKVLSVYAITATITRRNCPSGHESSGQKNVLA